MKFRLCISVLPLVGLLAALPATAGVIQGYTCSAPAFSMIGGWDGVGESQASMFVDAGYQPVSKTIEYSVRDRVTGLGKFTATWPVAVGSVPHVTGPSYVRIPIRASVPDEFTVTVSLDGASVGTHRFRREGQRIIDLDAAGFAAKGLLGPAIVSEGDHPWLPDLKGHRTISYDIRSSKASTIGETFLLPDWSVAEKQVASAFRTIEKLRKNHRCARAMMLWPS